MIHFHKWSKWATVEQGETYVRKFEGTGFVKYPIGRYVVQHRECSICGRKQIRKETTP